MMPYVGVRIWREHVPACKRVIDSLEDGLKMQDSVLPFLLFLCFMNECMY